MTDKNCKDCINKELRSFRSLPDVHYCFIDKSAILDELKPTREGEYFVELHEDKVFCVGCDKFKKIEHLNPPERCVLSLHPVTKIPITCDVMRLAGTESKCGIRGRYYKEKVVE